MLIALLSLLTPAMAGGGPWVVGDNQTSLFLGTESQRLQTLAVSTGSYSDDVIDVGGISTFGAKGIISYGLTPRIELEGAVPVYNVRALREDADVCGVLGSNACEDNQGVGVITLRGKALIVDEVYGPPLSVAIGPELRLGELTADTREQLTNIGEGTTDVGAFLALGRTGILGSAGAWSSSGEFGWRHRFPNTNFDGGLSVPGNEFYGSVEALFGGSLRWAVGPAITAYARPDGIDVEELLADPGYATDKDRLSALRAYAFQAGAKALVRSSGRITFSTSVYRTVYAVNNPSDVITIGVGLTIQDLLKTGPDIMSY